jgi:hypothetical protein
LIRICGDHTALKIKKIASGKHRWTVVEDVEVLVRELALLCQTAP